MPDKKLTPEEIRKLLTEPIDVEALLNVVKWDDQGLREFKVRDHWLNDDEPMVFEFDEPDAPDSFES